MTRREDWDNELKISEDVIRQNAMRKAEQVMYGMVVPEGLNLKAVVKTFGFLRVRPDLWGQVCTAAEGGDESALLLLKLRDG